VTNGRQVQAEGCLGVELADAPARLILVGRRAARAGQRVGRDRQKAGHRKASCDILDMSVEPAVLVYHDDGRAPLRPGPSVSDVAGDRPGGPVETGPCNLQRRIVRRDRRGRGVTILEQRQERGGSSSAARDPPKPAQEIAAVHPAVRVLVVQLDDAAIHSSASGMTSHRMR
jgi:hypothetical protein